VIHRIHNLYTRDPQGSLFLSKYYYLDIHNVKDAVLITFGCSWTFGEGSGYQDGMTLDQYKKIQLDSNICWKYGWRKKVVEHFKFKDHINFGEGGSSNDKQFRLAKQFFVSKQFKDLYNKTKNIVVLWGVTSVTRYDFWIKDKNKYEHIFLKSPEGKNWDPTEYGESSDWIAYYINKYCHWEPTRVRELELEFLYWNQYFKLLGIKNFWYDTFCSFNYKIELSNFFNIRKKRRDLLALIADNHGKTIFDFGFDDFDYALKNNLINPYSFHPKKEGYRLISNHIIDTLEKQI